MFTSLTGASKPHHVVDEDGVVLGYRSGPPEARTSMKCAVPVQGQGAELCAPACSHFGMLAAARWILQETLEPLKAALAEYPSFQLRIVGHSLGAGAAALLTMMCADPCWLAPSVRSVLIS